MAEKAETEVVCGILLKVPNKDMRRIKPKIIFSNYDDIKNPNYGGGGAVAVHEIAKRLTNSFEVTVITGSYKGATNEIIDKVAYKRIKTHHLGAKMGQLIFHFLLPFYVAYQDYDLWIESFTPPFSTSFLPIFTKKPIIGLVHMLAGEDMSRKYKIPFYLIENLGLKTYGYFIVLNKEAKDKIKNFSRKSRIKIIPNGVYLPMMLKMSDSDKEHILFIGRIEINQKGLDLLLKAYSIVSEKIKYKLAIAGSGINSELDKLKNIISSLKLDNKVEILGRIKDKKKDEVFKKTAFVVISSRFETFPLVALEAMSYNLPIVSFNIDGLKWIPAKYCLKAKPFNEADLSQKILNLSENYDLRRKMGDTGRRFASKFNWERKAKEYENFILEILNND